MGRKEVNDLASSPTPGAEAMDESPRKRRAASKRVSELVKQILQNESEDEDEDMQDLDSEGSEMGSDGDEGYIDAAEEVVEDGGDGVVEEAMKDAEEDTGDTINVKSEPEHEV